MYTILSYRFDYKLEIKTMFLPPTKTMKTLKEWYFAQQNQYAVNLIFKNVVNGEMAPIGYRTLLASISLIYARFRTDANMNWSFHWIKFLHKSVRSLFVAFGEFIDLNESKISILMIVQKVSYWRFIEFHDMNTLIWWQNLASLISWILCIWIIPTTCLLI